MSDSKSTKGARSQSHETTKAKGQKVSSERGSATNHKKNPGKRAHQGGGSR